MKQWNRLNLLLYIIDRYDVKSYLEVGCGHNAVFNAINVDNKIGVDPSKGRGSINMTSDEFFKQNKIKFDLIFIDGLHHAHQVYKDVNNALQCLNENGTIIMHDCNPSSKEMTVVPQPSFQHKWNGDCWKAYVYFRQQENLDMICSDFDYGCGIIKVRNNSNIISVPTKYLDLTWEDLQNNKDKWLLLKTKEEIISWL